MKRLRNSKSRTTYMNQNLWKSMRFEKSLSSETTIEAMRKSSRWNVTTIDIEEHIAKNCSKSKKSKSKLKIVAI